jgi:phosphatidate cytidylyltransferase
MSEPPPTAPNAGSDLPARVASAMVMAAAILAATWFGGWGFRGIWSAVGALVAYEWVRILGLPRGLAMATAATVAAIGLMAAFVPTPMVAGLILAGMLALYLFAGSGMAAAGLGYATVIALAPAALREVPELGLWLIIWSFAVVWFSDIVAYFAGRALGGPKLMPSVSPKKTWSGAIGGLLAGTAGGLAVWWAASRLAGPVPIGWAGAAAISALATILGQMGDLAESAFKRRYGVKDSSHIIPGHGGFMDRLDAYWSVVALAGAILLAVRMAG